MTTVTKRSVTAAVIDSTVGLPFCGPVCEADYTVEF